MMEGLTQSHHRQSLRHTLGGYFILIRPLSVDYLNGGSTDALKKAPVEKKNW